MGTSDRDVRLYRGLLLFVGAVYLLWWVAVRGILPNAFNPFGSRMAVVAAIWSLAGATFVSRAAREHVRFWWAAALWLLTAHYFYLFYNNASDLNWIVGAFIAVSAVSLGLFSRRSLLAYSAFTVALSLVLVASLPSLRDSVFLPGLCTVLLQANIGLQSRLKVIKNLGESTRRFRQLFDSTFEGILIIEQGLIVQVNDACSAALGYPSGEILGRSITELVHPDDRAGLEARIGEPTPKPVRGIRKDGSTVELEARGKPFTFDQRPALLITFQDVSERERQARALKQSNEALERSNIDLQRFAFVASHDLQTPLRGIGSFIGLLQATYAEKLDAQGNDWLTRTQRSVKQLQTLIQDLLDYSRLETEARPFTDVKMLEVLDRSKALLDGVMSETQAVVTHGELPVVIGDRSQLVQLLLNLMSNALKYRSAQPPHIHIAAERTDDGGWRFAVKDNGIGIAQKHQQQIFEVFRRLHTAKEYPGTGIGLAVCRRVVQQHGGRIWVESEEGHGSAFYFTLAREVTRG